MNAVTRATILTVFFAFATLYGCAFPGVYKLDIQQGNIVTQDMLDQLEAGMTQRQVAYVMGNPVLDNPFSQKRWDYIYTLEKRDEIVQRYHIKVFFDDAQLYTHYTGDVPQDENAINDSDDTLPAQEEKKNLLDTETL